MRAGPAVLAAAAILAGVAHGEGEEGGPKEKGAAPSSDPGHVSHHGLVLSGGGKARPVSMTSDRKEEVREIKPHDLITVRIKDGYAFVKSAKLTTDNKYDTKFSINKMFNITPGAGGSNVVARPTAGDKPAIDITSERKGDDSGSTGSKQSLDVILTAHVVEVYPNHTFSFEATQVTEQDENKMSITLFGIARVQDLSADNLLAGERVDSKQISVKNDGPVARMGKRGWFVKLLDLLWPF